VDFGFLDYSTLELRRWALERELTFNRAAAPDIYREVRRLTRTRDGGIEIDGEGEIVEYLLEMRRSGVRPNRRVVAVRAARVVSLSRLNDIIQY